MDSEVIQQMSELLIKSSLDGIKETVEKKLEEVETSFNAKLDGLKVSLNNQINTIETIAEDKPLVITTGTIEKPKKKIVHSAFMTVINILKSQKRIQKNIMFVGEAGSGKTHLANSIAEALGLEFYPMSVGLQTTKSDLLGFINAHGEYVTSPVRQAFEKGGVLLLDEFDATHAGVVTIINALLANGHCSFPDKIVEKNKDFICIVACNTYGLGANIDYVGRNRLDGATLDRFIVVDVGYDKHLEKVLTNNDTWLEIINKIRKNVKEQGIKMIISPRASMNGADLLDSGFKMKDVINMCILKGADKDTREKCLKGINIKESKIETKYIDSIDISTYVRNLSKYQTFEIRTRDKSYDEFISYIALNSKVYDEKIETTLSTCYIGETWIPEFSGPRSMFFSCKKSYIKGQGSCIMFSSPEQDRLKNLFNDLQIAKIEKLSTPVAFEFIEYGKQKPWKVITIGE